MMRKILVHIGRGLIRSLLSRRAWQRVAQFHGSAIENSSLPSAEQEEHDIQNGAGNPGWHIEPAG